MKRFQILAFAALLAIVLCGAAGAENEAWYYPDGKLFIPHVNLLDYQGNTVLSHAAFLQKDSRSWKFRIYALGPVAGSATSAVTTNLTGSWNFDFFETYRSTFNGTNFSRVSNGMNIISTNILLTLVQSNQTVTGTGLVSSVRYSLTGEVQGSLFWFHLLAGASNGAISVASGQADLGDGTLNGNYVWSPTNGTTVKEGTLTATQN